MWGGVGRCGEMWGADQCVGDGPLRAGGQGGLKGEGGGEGGIGDEEVGATTSLGVSAAAAPASLSMLKAE